ncbi:MAG: ACT domain-containing protein, partial [Caldimicrobium sp.]
QKEPYFLELLKKFSFKNEEELFISLGRSKLSIKQVIKAYSEINKNFPQIEEETSHEVVSYRKTTATNNIKPGITLAVDGNSDLLFHLAQCCRPICGDEVVGYITRGKGISVHRTDCPNLKNLDPERMIEVKWEKPDDKTYPAHLYVISIDRKGLLASVSSAIASAEGNILKAEVKTTPDKKAYFDIYVEVTDKNHLEKIIANISKVEGILKVERKLV